MSILTALAAQLDAPVSSAFGTAHLDVAPEAWTTAVGRARDVGLDFFDFLSAVDGPGHLSVVCHLSTSTPRSADGPREHVVLRTRLPGAEIGSVAHLFAGAGWHERETAEMFGITFLGPSGVALALERLLLPPGFAGHPLRKEALLAARIDRPWPGSVEPGESAPGAGRRRLRPPGVPEER